LKKKKRTIRRMTSNLALCAFSGKLTVQEVNDATKEKLVEDNFRGDTVLYCASRYCGIKIVEAILDKIVNIDELSHVSICCWYLLLMIAN
jgi:hypothetical protein